MDNGLIVLIASVSISLLVFILIVLWVFWHDITAIYRWHRVRKAHNLPKENLNTEKSSVFGSGFKGKNS